MERSDMSPWKSFLQALSLILHILHLGKFLTLRDERTNHIDLPPSFDFCIDEELYGFPFSWRYNLRFDDLPIPRLFEKYREIVIAVGRECECAWDWGCSHREEVRRALPLECFSLFHAKPVLLIHDRESQILE